MGLWSGTADVVLTPNGLVISLGDRLFLNFDEWVATEREEGAGRKERRQAEEAAPRRYAAYYLTRIE
jgi:hypothetical protein